MGMNIRRTERTLADGRAIFYYDTSEHQRTAVDRRPVEALSPIGELRYNALLDDWLVVAAHRGNRTFYPPTELCPLCPTAPDATTMLTEIPEPDYEVAVFDNRFPSLTSPTGAFQLPSPLDVEVMLAESAGKCEVVCFSSEHSISFYQLPTKQARVVLEAWIDRTQAMKELPYIQHVCPFENRGVEVGVTLPHPHGQIYGYSYLPIVVRQMQKAADEYFAKTGKILFDDVITREIHDDIRIIKRNDSWISYVPYAARYPFEIHVAPLHSVRTLPDLDEKQREDFAEIYLDALRRLDGVFGQPMPYMAAWHQAPLRDSKSNLRLHAQITSVRRSPEKLKYVAGSESAMGAWISDFAPEAAAAALRDVK